eukprot:PLAT2883.1.p1 GENE.PLAT2883.1~~PLAT2883.1.p1  ORF type:complete len:390 (-),score=144.30 PLAT2883.1:71-1240(-)
MLVVDGHGGRTVLVSSDDEELSAVKPAMQLLSSEDEADEEEEGALYRRPPASYSERRRVLTSSDEEEEAHSAGGDCPLMSSEEECDWLDDAADDEAEGKEAEEVEILEPLDSDGEWEGEEAELDDDSHSFVASDDAASDMELPTAEEEAEYDFEDDDDSFADEAGAEDAVVAVTKRNRQQLTADAFTWLNARVFDNQLPADLRIVWNNKLRSTAGLTKTQRQAGRYEAWVELATKVLDDSHKLRKTLLHELCHVAAWLLDHTRKPPHGPAFKRWAAVAGRRAPSLPVTTSHTYEIAFKYQYVCQNRSCGQTIGRHSKSIDVAAKCCGLCGGRLALAAPKRRDGTPKKARKPTAFSLFVKENYRTAAAELGGGAGHGAIMRALSAAWKAR